MAAWIDWGFMNTGNRPVLNNPPTSRQALSDTSETEIFAMRRRAWHEQGIVAIRLDDLADGSWLRAALKDFAIKAFGERQ